MSESGDRPDRVEQKTMVTGIVSAQQMEDLEQSVPAAWTPDEPAPYKQEPLFSKKVMVAWAAAAFAVWFGFTVIVPAIVESVKAAVIERVDAPASNTATQTIYTTPNGKLTITRTDNKITIERPDVRVIVPPTVTKVSGPEAPVAPVPAKKAAGETAPRR